MSNQVLMDNPAIKKWGKPHIQTVPNPVVKSKDRYWHFTATTRKDEYGRELNRKAEEWVDKQNEAFWARQA